MLPVVALGNNSFVFRVGNSAGAKCVYRSCDGKPPNPCSRCLRRGKPCEYLPLGKRGPKNKLDDLPPMTTIPDPLPVSTYEPPTSSSNLTTSSFDVHTLPNNTSNNNISPPPLSFQQETTIESPTSLSFPFLDLQIQMENPSSSSASSSPEIPVTETTSVVENASPPQSLEFIASMLFDPLPLEQNLISRSIAYQILSSFSNYMEFNGVFDPQVIREVIRVFRAEASHQQTDLSKQFLTCVGIAFGANREGHVEVGDTFFKEALQKSTQLSLSSPNLYSICGFTLLCFYVVQVNRFDLMFPLLQTAMECTKQKLRILHSKLLVSNSNSSSNNANAYSVYYGLLNSLRQFYLGSQFARVMHALSFRYISFFQNDPQIHANNARLCKILLQSPNNFLHPNSYTYQLMQQIETQILQQKRSAACAGMLTVGLSQYYLVTMLVQKYIAPSIEQYLSYLQKISENLDALAKYVNNYTVMEIQSRSLFMIWSLKLWIALENNDMPTLRIYSGLLKLLMQTMAPVGFIIIFFSLLFVVFEYLNDEDGFIITWEMIKKCIRMKYNLPLCFSVINQVRKWILKEGKSKNLKEFLEKETISQQMDSVSEEGYSLGLSPSRMSSPIGLSPPTGLPPTEQSLLSGVTSSGSPLQMPPYSNNSPPIKNAIQSSAGSLQKLFEIDESLLYFEFDNVRLAKN